MKKKSMESRCPQCGRANGCAIASGKPIKTCWCTKKQKLSEDILSSELRTCRQAACLCEHCYERLLAENIKNPVISA